MQEPKQLSKTIADTVSIELQEKFEKGQREHGGDFAVKPTIRNIREEVLDLVNYSHVLVLHRSQILVELDRLISDLRGLDTQVITIRLNKIKEQVHDL